MVLHYVFLHVLREEADEFIAIGALNGLFVLGRSMGFIGKNYTKTCKSLIFWLIIFSSFSRSSKHSR